jgi:hypothetical protein
MKLGQMQTRFDDFIGSTASVSVYNKLEDGEPIDIKHPCLRKHRESAESHIEADYIVFWSLFLLRCARFDSASTFRYNLKNS